MYDFVYNLTPPYIPELFSYSLEKHHYYKRPQRLATPILNIREQNYEKLFSRLGARIWNSIPICLRSLPMYKFERLLHGQLLNVWMREDT